MGLIRRKDRQKKVLEDDIDMHYLYEEAEDGTPKLVRKKDGAMVYVENSELHYRYPSNGYKDFCVHEYDVKQTCTPILRSYIWSCLDKDPIVADEDVDKFCLKILGKVKNSGIVRECLEYRTIDAPDLSMSFTHGPTTWFYSNGIYLSDIVDGSNLHYVKGSCGYYRRVGVRPDLEEVIRVIDLIGMHDYDVNEFADFYNSMAGKSGYTDKEGVIKAIQKKLPFGRLSTALNGSMVFLKWCAKEFTCFGDYIDVK